jgi:hypothetical protein
MNAREEIAYHLWTSVPSSDNAEAKARAGEMLDAYRVDVLVEAEVEIRLATERNRAEHPDVEAMVIRRLGMRAAERVVEGMRVEMAGEEATAAAATATPDFFQPGHTYTREHHATTIRFLVRGVSWAPDHSYRVAFGWRTDEDGDWEFTDSDDMDGWTDVTEAGDGS